MTSLANQLPGFHRSRLRILSMTQFRADDFWALGARRSLASHVASLASPQISPHTSHPTLPSTLPAITTAPARVPSTSPHSYTHSAPRPLAPRAPWRALQTAPAYYVQLRVGLSLAVGTLAPSAADRETYEELVLRMRAAVRNDPAALRLSVPFLPLRSSLCNREVADDCTNTDTSQPHFQMAPPPSAPPIDDRLHPPAPPHAPLPPDAPPPLTWQEETLPWLIPLVVFGALLLCCLCVVNVAFLARVLSPAARVTVSEHSPKSAPKSASSEPASGSGARIEEGFTKGDSSKRKRRRRAKRVRGLADGMVDGMVDGRQGDGREAEGSDSQTEEGTEEAEEEAAARRPKSVTISAPASLTPQAASVRSAPRSPASCRAADFALAATAPPIFVGAKLKVGPLGKPTWTLPPVQPGSPEATLRQMRTRAMRMPGYG